MRIVPKKYIKIIKGYTNTSTPLTSVNSEIVRIALCIIDVLARHKLISFRPNWLDIGTVGKIKLSSEDMFFVYLSGDKAGELSHTVTNKKDVAMVFQYRYVYDPDIVPVLLQGLDIHELIDICKSVKSKNDPFYTLCMKNLNFWKMKAIEIGVNPDDLPDMNDPLAFRKIVKLITNKNDQNIIAEIQKNVHIANSLTQYTSRQLTKKMIKDINIGDEQIIKRVSRLSENGKLMLINVHPYYVKYISNPSINIQREAIKNHVHYLQFIKNPALEVQLEAVKRDGCVIKFIKNPSEKVQLKAVEDDGEAIRYIKNPSLNVQLVAVNDEPHAIRYIKKPYEEVTRYVSSLNE